jgi:hypothetical protein
MLARSSKLVHPTSGTVVETPLLIPSFSSKGFARRKKDKQSEIRTAFEYASEFLTSTCLISAYDLHYGHIPSLEEIKKIPELFVVDSGGYEISFDHDYSAVVHTDPEENDWSREIHKGVIKNWPEEIPTVFVSYDHPREWHSLNEQVVFAKELFQSCPGHLKLLLIKPEAEKHKTIQTALNNALADIEQLDYFDIIGVTEKELGSSIMDRMANISILRRALDLAVITAPIHVFGALDPLTVKLYFISGAEIFDGLTWIRYAYHHGCCTYLQNHAVLAFGLHGLHSGDAEIKFRTMTENIYALLEQENAMRDYLTTGDLKKLSPHEDVLKNAKDSLQTRIKEAV